MALNETKLYDNLKELVLTTVETIRNADNEPNRTEPNRTEPNRTEPNRTEPNRTEPLITLFSAFCNSFRCRKALLRN